MAALAGRIAILAVALTSGGCSLVQPTARATAASLERTAGDVGQLAIELELGNPGRDEIELVEYDYLVTLSDGASYGGRWAALRALPPEQVVRATIPAILPAASLRGGGAWRVSGTLRYRDPQSVSRILYELGLVETKVSFEGSGVSFEGSGVSFEGSGDSIRPAAEPAPEAPGAG